MGQWLVLYDFNAKGMGSIPGCGTEIAQARCPKEKEYCLKITHFCFLFPSGILSETFRTPMSREHRQGGPE